MATKAVNKEFDPYKSAASLYGQLVELEDFNLHDTLSECNNESEVRYFMENYITGTLGLYLW